MTPHVDPEALARHLSRMPGPRRQPRDALNVRATLDYLEEVFTSAGWTVRRQHCRDEMLGDGANLIARLSGATDELVVVGAHHDTVADSPGADDNGSGLAALLELARLLGSGLWRATIELVAFDFEERSDPLVPGSGFTGSRAYVASLDGQRLRGAVVYDLIACASDAPGSQRFPQGLELLFPREASLLAERQGRADFVAALANAERGGDLLRAFVVAAAASGLPAFPLGVPAGTPVRDVYRSDHSVFWEAGLPALFVTDTANFRNAHYHQPTDTVETLDRVFWARVVEATFGAVAELAGPGA